MIEIRDLTKSFNDTRVLNHLNLMIPEGSVFGLIGPNGCGKSTLLCLMNGVLKADTGDILYNGKEVYEDPEVKKDILLISDDPFYFNFATVLKMKEFYELWYPTFDEVAFYEYIRIFSLPLTKPIKNFSKGMKRQAILAIALAISPKYLFLDEAFDGLDPVMRLSFKRVIGKCIEEKEMTVVISSHNLRELEDICDYYGIIDEGQILNSGNIAESENNIHKIQLAFKDFVTKDMFDSLDTLHLSIEGKVATMIVRGDLTAIEETLNAMNPLLLQSLPVNLEEVFIYEMERKGYGVYD